MEIRVTPVFKRRIKKLQKRYRRIKHDLRPVISELEQGNLIGDQILGIRQTVFKVRAANSDIPAGKSGGYRLIYQLVNDEVVLLLVIYAKSEQTTISAAEIEEIIKMTLD
jgi:mRNA-degrading endonuclease RelE of RelBE toxin-antitoxin system